MTAVIHWTLENIIIAIIVLAGVCAIALVATRAMGINIPQWVFQIFWIVIVVVVAVLAIRFLFSL